MGHVGDRRGKQLLPLRLCQRYAAAGAPLQAPAVALRSKCQAALAGSIASAGPGAAVKVGSTLSQLHGQRRRGLRLSYRVCVGVREWEGWGA